MKKLFGIAAVIAMAFCSCSSDDSIYPPIEKVKTRSSSLEILVGNMRGFQTTTRGCDVAGNMWSNVPDYPTDKEKADVMAYIAANSDKNIEVTAWNWQYYFIQHVDGAHRKYEYEDWNHSWHRDIDGTASMEFMQVMEYSGNWQHVYNFNAGKCDNSATHNCSLMTNGFKDAKTLNEYSSSTIDAWRLYEFNGNFYIGFDFSAKKGDGEIKGDGIYDDWVVKIIPGKGEKDPSPVPNYTPKEDPKGDPDKDPEDPETPAGPEVEFDVHQQQHTDWNEIKTSIHLRDTVNTRIFIPIPVEYQAECDDFNIRTGVDYAYKTEPLSCHFTIVSNEYDVEVEVNHLPTGVEILVGGAQLAAALRDARGVYDDGITFEIHTYVKPTATNEQIWSWLKQTQRVQTSMNKWPVAGENITTTYGQVTSVFFPDESILYPRLEPEK